MQLESYLEEIREHVAVAAEAAGAEAQTLADRLLAPLDAAVQLALQHALADAADEITTELAPTSVELRVRGRELAFVVTSPPPDPSVDEQSAPSDAAPDDDGGEMARINLRMPEQLKARVDQAADAQRLSTNAWLVRAAAAALERADPPIPHSHPTRGAQRYRGWAK
jgi:hypothetical protein